MIISLSLFCLPFLIRHYLSNTHLDLLGTAARDAGGRLKFVSKPPYIQCL